MTACHNLKNGADAGNFRTKECGTYALIRIKITKRKKQYVNSLPEGEQFLQG